MKFLDLIVLLHLSKAPSKITILNLITAKNIMHKIIQIKLFVGVLTAFFLTACGGGGGGSNAGSNGANLDKYIGNWGSCQNGNMGIYAITKAANGGINVSGGSQFYADDNCTGAIVASGTSTVIINFTLSGSRMFSYPLPPTNTPTTVISDTVNYTNTSGQMTYSGSGVTHTFVGGQWKWCFTQRLNVQTCIGDGGLMFSVVTPTPGSEFYLSGNYFYVFVAGMLDTTYAKL